MSLTAKLLSIFALTATILTAATTKIACVGDSITFGAGVAARERLAYPQQLGYLLGNDYEVRNFGHSGATMLRNGNLPYHEQPEYQASLDFAPDIVFIKLGTNDSKPQNWAHKADFVADAKTLAQSYLDLPSRPRVIFCKPVPVTKGNWQITEAVTRNEVAPAIERAASKLGLELVDLHLPFRDHHDWLPDGVHPNAFGAEAIARHLHRYLTIPVDSAPQLTYPEPTASGHFGSYERIDFQLGNNIACKIVKPRRVARDAPWIWRARFWGHEPQFDLTMLELGYHIVYCDVADLFGSPQAVERWNACYRATQQIGLNEKPVLEGMSRGGLITHNWAVANPGKVAALIADNAVLDFTSWPGGLGIGEGSAQAWQRCKQAYNLADDASAKAYPSQPIHTVETLARARIPLLYLVGLNDDLVPPQENSLKAIEQLQGYTLLETIEKPGKGHHPHSLPNPAPIVDFALRATGHYQNPAALPAPSAEFRGRQAGWGGGIWWDQHDNINQIAREHRDLDLIFLGDSISQSWTGPHKRLSNPEGNRPFDQAFGSKWKAASFGISGDRTEHLLFRIQNGNFDGLEPKVVVLMIGVNNILGCGHNAAQISGGIKEVAKALLLKLPDTEILLLGPLPTAWQPDDPKRVVCNNVQEQIAELDQHPRVHHVDLTADFTNPNGTLRKDLYGGDSIHLKGPGYKHWAKLLLPHIEQFAR